MYYLQPRHRKLIFDGNSLFNYGNANVINLYEAPNAAYNSLTGTRPCMEYYAVGGRRVQQLIDEFPTKIAPIMKNGDILVMNEQTNSLKDLLDANTVYGQLQTYFALVKEYFPNSPTIYVNMIARDRAGDPSMEALRLELNTLTATLANANTVVNAGGLPQFDSVADCSNATNYNADKLHLTTVGYGLYAAPVTTAIQAFL